jgi:DNA-binding response OmpR family regulator
MSKILIIEDDPSIRKLVRVNLVKRGYTVYEAENSIEAIAAFQDNGVNLVLLDLMLPRLSGVDVCKWIRAHSDVPIIVLSARLEKDLKIAAFDAGANDFITKPFAMKDLLVRIHDLLCFTSVTVNQI